MMNLLKFISSFFVEILADRCRNLLIRMILVLRQIKNDDSFVDHYVAFIVLNCLVKIEM